MGYFIFILLLFLMGIASWFQHKSKMSKDVKEDKPTQEEENDEYYKNIKNAK